MKERHLVLTTEPEIMVGTWLGECCRQVEPEEVSNSVNTIHQTTYQPSFLALYYRKERHPAHTTTGWDGILFKRFNKIVPKSLPEYEAP